MRENRPYGLVRGALSNERPYRDRFTMTEPISLSNLTMPVLHFNCETALLSAASLVFDGQRAGPGTAMKS